LMAKNGVGSITKARMVRTKGVASVVLPDDFKPENDKVVWRKTDEGYLLTNRNEFDDLLEYLEKNPPPETMLTSRPKQFPAVERRWWYEE